jgi:hypothetical protein
MWVVDSCMDRILIIFGLGNSSKYLDRKDYVIILCMYILDVHH